ncbi:hypothetical protein OPV22_034919 [Ensete ventricosum]|uniref:Uncharacterized protein n=1 Tax=Ensete ventricosum TaxID=4639 RepID=A0AAV8PM44_ENSVE|nr:hypothetical protein OPV22_034919 [Ensete ventricosum]
MSVKGSKYKCFHDPYPPTTAVTDFAKDSSVLLVMAWLMSKRQRQQHIECMRCTTTTLSAELHVSTWYVQITEA